MYHLMPGRSAFEPPMPMTPSALAPNLPLYIGNAVPTPTKNTLGLKPSTLDVSVMRERVGRIAEGKERVGIGRLRVLEHRLHVLRAERIGLVIDEIEAGLLQPFARRGRLLDAELIADRDHRDLVADLAVLLQAWRSVSTIPSTISDGRPSQKVRFGQRLVSSGALVGVGGDGELRIAELVEDRRGREIHAGAPGRQDEVDLVLRRETLDRLDHLFRIAAVVVFDDLDLQLLAADS